MTSSRRLDCSLDQLIDQRDGPRAHNVNQRRREGGAAPSTRVLRRVIETPESPPPNENGGALQLAVRKQTMKKQPPARPTHTGIKLSPAESALHISTVRREPNGDVVVSFKNTDVLTAEAATGNLTLNSGGYRTFSTRAVLCAALLPIGLKVDGDASKPDNEEGSDNWSVSDGRAFLQKFEDNMVVQQIGRLTRHQLLARPSVILQYMQQKKAGLAKKAGRSGRPTGGALKRSQEAATQEDRSMTEAVED